MTKPWTVSWALAGPQEDCLQFRVWVLGFGGVEVFKMSLGFRSIFEFSSIAGTGIHGSDLGLGPRVNGLEFTCGGVP